MIVAGSAVVNVNITKNLSDHVFPYACARIRSLRVNAVEGAREGDGFADVV